MKFWLYLFFIIFIGSSTLHSQTTKQEAQKEVTNFVNSIFLKNSGDYFTMNLTVIFNPRDTKDKSKYQKYIYQFKNLQFKIDSLPVSYIDSLNGYKWFGNLTITASAYREIFWSNNPGSEVTNSLFSQAQWRKWKAFDTITTRFDKWYTYWQGIGFPIEEPPNYLPDITELNTLLQR